MKNNLVFAQICAGFVLLACSLLVALMAGGGSVQAAGNGEALYQSRACQACHGLPGRDPLMPSYPRLAGQNAQYLYQQMLDIRDGKRTNSMSAAMRATVSRVSDAEFQALAHWLASQ